MEYLVGFPSKEFINTNNSYGYGCGYAYLRHQRDQKK